MNELELSSKYRGIVCAGPTAHEYQGEHKTTKEGEPLYRYEVVIWARADQERQVVKIKTAQREELPLGAPVSFEGLSGRMWQIDGRAGISLTADAIKPITRTES